MTEEERRQRRIVSNREYYQRQKALREQTRATLDMPQQMFEPVELTLNVDEYHEKYELKTKDDYLAYIDKCLSCLVKYNAIDSYELSRGFGTGADFAPVRTWNQK